MKKYINLAFIYTILALVVGVFYREFTKFYNYDGATSLSVIHTHLLALGMLFFLLTAIFQHIVNIEEGFRYKVFMVTYNIGLIMSVLMLFLRGLTEVLEVSISSGVDAGISGFAGLGHMILSIGLVFYFLNLLYKLKNNKLVK